MPWKTVKSGDGFDVVKKGSGDIVGHHQNEAAANAQVRALYANADGKDKNKYKKTRSAKQQGLKDAIMRRSGKKKKGKNPQGMDQSKNNDHEY